jgi:halocyanin-like protein
MTEDGLSRRRFLRAGAPVAVAVSGVLAGCPDPGETVFDAVDGGDGDGPGSGTGPERRNDVVFTAEPEYEGWFDDVSNYDAGTVVYTRETGTVSVTVGATGNGGDRAFRYPAIAVAVGTTVRWKWRGDGGEHNVVATEGEFDSGAPTADPETTFSRRFRSTGTYRYVCETHRDAGMKGAVTVYEAG